MPALPAGCGAMRGACLWGRQVCQGCRPRALARRLLLGRLVSGALQLLCPGRCQRCGVLHALCVLILKPDRQCEAVSQGSAQERNLSHASCATQGFGDGLAGRSEVQAARLIRGRCTMPEAGHTTQHAQQAHLHPG